MITGKNGFLYKKLQNKLILDETFYFDLGATICTDSSISSDICQKIHKETLEKINIFSNLDKECTIIFASTTGITDINFQHKESTCYNLSKLFIENWLVNSGRKYIILRIGTIYSLDKNDYYIMKTDRLPSKLFLKGISGLTDQEKQEINISQSFLEVNTFVNETIKIIEDYKKNQKSKIFEYSLEKFTILEILLLLRKIN